MLLLKYLTAVLSCAITLAGAWFFEFTRTNPTTQTKTLTPWGKLFLPLALLCLVVSGGLTAWTDRADGEKNRIKDAQIADFQTKVVDGQSDSKRLLELIASIVKNSRLDSSSQQEILHTIPSLSNIEDYKRQYPDLYAQLLSANSVDSAQRIMFQGISRKVDERISKNPDCANLPIHSSTPDNPMKVGTVFLERPRSTGSILRSLFLRVDGEGVEFEVRDLSGPIDLESGYSLEFEGGIQSDRIHCSTPGFLSCTANTFSPAAKALYRLAQKNVITKVRTSKAEFSIDPTAAREVKRTFACIEP